LTRRYLIASLLLLLGGAITLSLDAAGAPESLLPAGMEMQGAARATGRQGVH
jgi:hypothetical protein